MNKRRSHHVSRGSVLAMAILVIAIGSAIVGSLMNLVSQDTMAVEKEIGHIKSKQVLTLAANLYNETLGNNTGTVTASQITDLTQLIGGGGSQRPLFGQSSSSENATVPGFDEYTVVWNQTSNTNSTTMLPPAGLNGFWYFPGTMSATITAIHTGDSVPATRKGAKALISSNNETQTVPVFSMLSFYDKDWEISAHWESAQSIGHIHSNGSIYLDCRSSGPDRISFHGLQDFPILSADKVVYRRGRNGATSWYKFGNTANAGLDFYIYNAANFNALINNADGNYTDNSGGRIFTRDLTPDFTTYEEGDIVDDTGEEPERRRFGGGNEGDEYGYVFEGVSSVTGQSFLTVDTNGDNVAVVQYGDQVDNLTPPVAINPYQYIDDIQFFDTPDTVNFQVPVSSNYQEDAASGGDLESLAFSAIAPLVIRDGVAYYRTSPGGSLTPVIQNLLIDSDTAYPDDSHADAKYYGDLRWYGWFGMYDGISPSETNPARWHFPVRSVTYNKTQDASNAGSAGTSSEGTAVAFTYDSATVHNPVADGMANLGGTSVAASWIRTNIDMTDLPGYPGLNANAPSDTTNGEGVGMYYSAYPTIEGNTFERYDPVRVAYNLVKADVRSMHNASHLYTSRHSGTVMLDIDGDVPTPAGSAPDIWGSGIDATNFNNGLDYDDADGDNKINTGVNFSAFWNDDGITLAGLTGSNFYEYLRNQSTTVGDVNNGTLFPNGVVDTTPKVELFPIRHGTMTNLGTAANSMDDWFIYKSTLPLSDRTLPMPSSRDNLDGINYTAGAGGGYGYIAENRTTNFGYAGTPTGNHNWFVLLNNAPEMLARQNDGAGGITFETTFAYNGGDVGGYYGNDNLCMIDGQEKKIVVFTEIDMAEFTREALIFNKLDIEWGFTFDSNTATVTDTNMLQNIVYVVNTSMGLNFFGRRVHTGAVRLKRGTLIGNPLSIVTPNALHVWGDFNNPGYWHHGKRQGSNNVTYTVPTSREHDAFTTVTKAPVALYADSIHAYENSWIRFNPTNNSANNIRDAGYGSLQTNIGSGTGDNQERISFDHKLWWEDDGMRRSGANGGTATPVISSFGSQYFLNYHETIFDHDNNGYYLSNSAWNRGRSSQIWKHIPQGINAALMYGNVTSRLPSYFWDVDVQPLLASRPASVDLLNWLKSWIPRSRWIELERDEMMDVTSGGFDPTNGGTKPEFYAPASDLAPDNYFGTDFPGGGFSEWEEVKLAFSGGGFMYDIRFHTNHTHNLAEWTNNRQTFGRNIQGAFACLFDSRQATHGYNETMLGSENQQIFYAFDTAFQNSNQLPPGTPMATRIPDVVYSVEGAKWEYQ